MNSSASAAGRRRSTTRVATIGTLLAIGISPALPTAVLAASDKPQVLLVVAVDFGGSVNRKPWPDQVARSQKEP